MHYFGGIVIQVEVKLMFDWILLMEVLLVIAIMSLPLYKENPAFRICEHLAIGMAAANTLIVSLKAFQSGALAPLQSGKILVIIPIVLGIAVLFRLLPGYGWIARYPISFILGAGTALAMRSAVESMIVGQVVDTITFSGGSSLDTFNFIVMAIGTFTAMTYFIFIKEHKGALGISSKIGRLFLMAGFGTGYYTLQTLYLGYLIPQLAKIIKLLGLG